MAKRHHRFSHPRDESPPEQHAMPRIKRIALFAIALSSSAALCGCGGSASPSAHTIKPVPIPTVSPAASSTPVEPISEAAPSPGPCGTSTCTGSPGPDLVAALTDRARTLKTACYYPALAQHPTLHGRIVITLKITETGKVCSALLEKNEMATPAVADCSIEAYRNLSLPPPQGSSCILVSVPINFVPSPP